MAGVIYVLVGTKKSGAEVIYYCGRADDASSRLQQHRRDYEDPLNDKAAHEYARQEFNGNWRMEVIAKEDASNTEDFWVKTLLAEGHPLKNATGGNSVVPKNRKPSEVSKAFRATNAQAKQACLEDSLKDARVRERLVNANRCIFPECLNSRSA